ncbi:class I SAM-dependent methyltransferase [Stutzerimonas nitrititolerans]|uniref:class I SAM-dependent methyltransferase n=1 Tax=Stutzerimonas nitrititolerans TaxID=2482751 RepID=UPI00202865C4|nr:class I SAM-dependent methyltransferase [Stutzerimonas nitrititolerans]
MNYHLTKLTIENMRICEICSGGDLDFIHRQHFLFPGQVAPAHYDVMACKGCGFVYASDIPDQSALNQFYQAVEHHLHAELPPGLARIHADFFQFVHHHASLSSDARILDIGSGMGHFLHHFQKAGFKDLQGMEPSLAAAELARKTYGLNIHSASMDTFTASKRFDLISLCGVLEHIADLRRSMERISALLRDDGYLFIAVPDASSFGRAVPAEPFLEFALEHINFFSATSLDNLLRACGFEKVIVASQHNDFYDNSYLLALYRRVAEPSSAIVSDSEAAPSLRAYVDLSRQGLQSVEAVAAQLVKSQEPLLLWGAGALTSRLLCDTSLGQANIRGVIDRNKGLQGKTLLNTLITPPDSIGHHQGATVFIASTTYAAEIRETLLRQHAWTGRIITLASGAAS